MPRKKDILYCPWCGRRMEWESEQGGLFTDYQETYVCPKCGVEKVVVHRHTSEMEKVARRARHGKIT